MICDTCLRLNECIVDDACPVLALPVGMRYSVDLTPVVIPPKSEFAYGMRSAGLPWSFIAKALTQPDAPSTSPSTVSTMARAYAIGHGLSTHVFTELDGDCNDCMTCPMGDDC